jgi:hypothetical protein
VFVEIEIIAKECFKERIVNKYKLYIKKCCLLKNIY